MRKIKLLFMLGLSFSLLSCGGDKLAGTENQEEAQVDRVFPPIGLYYGKPTSMLGGTPDPDYEIKPSNLPDFVNYPNDLTKMGLRGRVKSVREGVSTFSWSYDFNPAGNLTDYQFRMDSKGRYGEGARAEYNGAGELTLLGRNFHGQSPNSHAYSYKNGKLVRRSSSRGERIYFYHDSAGVSVPDSIVTKGLTPYLNIKFVQEDNMINVGRMTYKRPSLPGNITADNAESIMEYTAEGQLKAMRTVYRNVKGYKTPTLYGLTQFFYNEQGDVTKMEYYLFTDKTPLTDETLLSTAVHHGIDTYDYQYDEQGNWVELTMNSQPKAANTVVINTLSRTIEYYSDEELQAIEQENKELEEKPFVGVWTYTETDDLGDDNRYDYNGTITLNLYEKFMFEGIDEPQWGIIHSSMSNTLGKNRNSAYNITDFKIRGNTVKVNLEDYFSGARYSATLTYNSQDKSMTISDVIETYEGEPDMFDYIQEPYSVKYTYKTRSTQ